MKYIPYGRHKIDNMDIREVVKVLRSDWITQGQKVNEFENRLAEYCGAKYAVVVSSGTAALHIAALAAGIKPGNEVITSPITFVASANCVLYCGGNPVFVDVERDTANIDIEKIENSITHRTKAIIPIHFAGHPCDLEKIKKIANNYKLIVIEDAAHALGARYKDYKIGSCRYSDMTIFSFHPVKAITTGEGGAILTNSKKLYERFILLRNHGITKEPKKFINPNGLFYNTDLWYYEMQSLGFNYRITDIQATLGISQLRKLDKFIYRRREIAVIYSRLFRDNPYFDIPLEKEYAYSAYHLYPIRLKKGYKDKRQKIFLTIRSKGLGIQIHYIPVYLQPYYKMLGFKKGICPNAEDFYNSEISINIYPGLKDFQIRRIAKIILNACRVSVKQ